MTIDPAWEAARVQLAAAQEVHDNAFKAMHDAEWASGAAQNNFRIKPSLSTFNAMIAAGAKWLELLEAAEKAKEKVMQAVATKNAVERKDSK